MSSASGSASDQAILSIMRPHEKLLTYYLLKSFAAGPGFPVLMLVLYFRYHSMRYRFDDQGISMSWGILFRHQILLNYARIQDVHLESNAIERWFGLARIEVQTASGGSMPEMTIEGLLEYETVRDFLYSRMRGAAEKHPGSSGDPTQNLSGTLQNIATELREIRLLLAGRNRV